MASAARAQRRALIYCRISLDLDGDGLGVARQEQDCRALAATLGWTVVDVLVDNSVSAYSGKRRPGYEQLLKMLESGLADAVIVWKPDRLHRRPVELEHFIDLVETHGIEVATVAGGAYDLTTSEGRAMARVVGAFARMESEVKADRTRRKHLELAQAGASVGGTRAFGYEKGGLVIRESEATLIREAAATVLAGGTLRSICVKWQRTNAEPSRGGRWSQTSIRRILTSHRIAGIRALAGEPVAAAAWPAIIDLETHERLRAILLAPGRTRGGYGPRTHVLTGLLRCGKCGTKLIARPQSNRRRTYVCTSNPDKGGCGGIRIVAEPLEEWIADLVCAALDGEAVQRAEAQRKAPNDTGLIVTRLAAAEAKLRELAEDFADDRITRSEWLAARSRLEERTEDLRRTIAERQAEASREAFAGQGASLRARWPGLGIDRQRDVLEAVVEHVSIGPAVKGWNRFDHRRATVAWKV